MPASRGPLLLAAVVLAALASLACTLPGARRPTTTPTATASASATATPGVRTDAQIEALLRRAVCWYPDPALARTCLPLQPDARAAIEEMAQSGDRRFVAPLVDMAQIDVGWGPQVDLALRRLTGDRADSPRSWRGWLGGHLPAPTTRGYAEWKARLLALTQEPDTKPTYRDLITERLGAALPLLHWTQAQPNASKPLTTPRAVAGRTATWLDPDEVVYGLAVGGTARAYPRRIVAWHGAVNDVLGGQPVLLAVCAPCGSAVAFDRRLESDTLEFGTSGLVIQSRALLFDQRGHRLWDALTGADLGDAKVALAPVPMFTTTWADWFARHPETTVLDLTTGTVRDYSPNAALAEVLAAPGALYPASGGDPRLSAKEVVVGVDAGAERRAYPLAEVARRRLIRDRIGQQEVVIVTEGEGRAVGVYDASGVEFLRIIDSGVDLVLADRDGNRWAMRESALINERTRDTRRALPTRQSYWFAWASAYPSTSVFTP